MDTAADLGTLDFVMEEDDLGMDTTFGILGILKRCPYDVPVIPKRKDSKRKILKTYCSPKWKDIHHTMNR